jgi:hypothetical protein
VEKSNIVWDKVEDLFEEFVDTGWNDESRLILLADFLQKESARSPGLMDRLQEFLAERAEDEGNEIDEYEEE